MEGMKAAEGTLSLHEASRRAFASYSPMSSTARYSESRSPWSPADWKSLSPFSVAPWIAADGGPWQPDKSYPPDVANLDAAGTLLFKPKADQLAFAERTKRLIREHLREKFLDA
jgi:hypothetical protein